jgi:hypothetical protein
MFQATTYSQLNRQIDTKSISRELVKILENIRFFGIGSVTNIIRASEDGEIDEEEDPKQVVILTIETRCNFIDCLNEAIATEAALRLGRDFDALAPNDLASYWTIRTLICLKDIIADPNARYLCFQD